MFEQYQARPPRVKAQCITQDSIFDLAREYNGTIKQYEDGGFYLQFQAKSGQVLTAGMGEYLLDYGSNSFVVMSHFDFEAQWEKVEEKKEALTEDTLFKVHRVIRDFAESDEVATDLINQLQNEGILFRERA